MYLAHFTFMAGWAKIAELARVIKAGACIEASFKRGKGEAGMDKYQVRTVRRESTV